MHCLIKLEIIFYRRKAAKIVIPWRGISARGAGGSNDFTKSKPTSVFAGNTRRITNLGATSRSGGTFFSSDVIRLEARADPRRTRGSMGLLGPPGAATRTNARTNYFTPKLDTSVLILALYLCPWQSR